MDRSIVAFVVLAVCFAAHASRAADVGFRRIQIEDSVIAATFPVALWYPTRDEASTRAFGPYTMRVAQAGQPAGGKLRLVVISHGAGGDALAHRDLAMALAAAGYVVAAPMHPRDNYQDMSGIGSATVWAGRPRQVSLTIDGVLADRMLGPLIEREHVGVVGHSAGGYTALAIAGAQPSLASLVQHCKDTPADARFCAFGGSAARDAALKGGDIPDMRDDRVRVIVLLAPVAALFSDAALSRVTVPVRVYAAERDDLTVPRYHAERLAKVLGERAEYVSVKGAGHYSFIASYPEALKKAVRDAGEDPPGFDRDAMHEALNPEILAFFNRTLK